MEVCKYRYKLGSGEGKEEEGTNHSVTSTAALVRERISRRALDTEHGANLTGSNRVDILHLVRMHPNQPRDLDLLARADVRDRSSLLECALVHTDVGELTVAALLELEGERDEGSVGSGGEGLGSVVGRLDGEGMRGSLLRSGEVETDTVEDLLDRLVGESGTDEDGGEFERDSRPADSGL